MPRSADTRTVLRTFQPQDLPQVVSFWNEAYGDQRNFWPQTEETFRRRVLQCAAFDPAGFILVWDEAGKRRELAGMVHAFRPMPVSGVYAKWGAQPGIAHIYVRPVSRGRGVGSGLLRAAENWLYYCPVYVGGPGQPCYGAVEGPNPPLFGSTQALSINADNIELLRFFAKRGYQVHESGDVSLRLVFARLLSAPPVPPKIALQRFQLEEVSHLAPFTGEEPPGREEYTLWGDNGGDPYTAFILTDHERRLYGHISWYPMPRPGHAGIAGFWLAPHLRSEGLGTWLLDTALHRMQTGPAPIGGYTAVEVHTHVVRHPVATKLYESRGFQVEAAWVQLVKT